MKIIGGMKILLQCMIKVCEAKVSHITCRQWSQKSGMDGNQGEHKGHNNVDEFNLVLKRDKDDVPKEGK